MLIRNPRDLALFVRDQRKKLKKSQADIGDLVGLKQQTISAFENNPENSQLNTLFSILSAVELNLNVIEKGKEKTLKSEWKEEW